MRITFTDTQTLSLQLYATWLKRDTADPAVLGSMLAELVEAQLEQIRNVPSPQNPPAALAVPRETAVGS